MSDHIVSVGMLTINDLVEFGVFSCPPLTQYQKHSVATMVPESCIVPLGTIKVCGSSVMFLNVFHHALCCGKCFDMKFSVGF